MTKTKKMRSWQSCCFAWALSIVLLLPAKIAASIESLFNLKNVLK